MFGESIGWTLTLKSDLISGTLLWFGFDTVCISMKSARWTPDREAMDGDGNMRSSTNEPALFGPRVVLHQQERHVKERPSNGAHRASQITFEPGRVTKRIASG